jgi:hypothetical protein
MALLCRLQGFVCERSPRLTASFDRIRARRNSLGSQRAALLAPSDDYPLMSIGTATSKIIPLGRFAKARRLPP